MRYSNIRTGWTELNERFLATRMGLPSGKMVYKYEAAIALRKLLDIWTRPGILPIVDSPIKHGDFLWLR